MEENTRGGFETRANGYSRDGSSPFKLYRFTTSELDTDEAIRLYGLRWNVETDLRTLKKNIHLEVRECRTPEMVAKKNVFCHHGLQSGMSGDRRVGPKNPPRFTPV